ncbi:MAG: SHOCT domain-containing protein, partial [Chloroflexales bacterium]|nr:SHOCT domain-containing protein [Chloroflexales bacterium]
ATTPMAAPARADGDGGVAQALHSLALLRDQNLLTPEEFEAKKREILRRL